MKPSSLTREVERDASGAERPLEHCLRTGGFLWLTGIEDTFITAPDAKTGRTLDEYELTGHYDSWRDDLERARSLGVVAMRYGIPWHRLNPARNQWDFSWSDETLEYLSSLGIHPIVDLVHYGVPLWIEGAFVHADYDRYVEEYAQRVAERYRGRIHYYTPFNEPRITAWYCGKLGHWPPYRHGHRGFVSVMAAICRGMVKTMRALRSVDPEILCVHADACDLYEAGDSGLEEEARRRQELVFLALDLVTGRVTDEHPLRAWLGRHGLDEATLAWFMNNVCPPDVVGLNLYPMFSSKVLYRRAGRLRIRMPYARPTIVERLLSLYGERYELPMLITETATRGSVGRRRVWLEDSVAATARARQRGIPVLGYTWWPMFALVRWAYRRGRRPAAHYLEQMGLFDLHPDASGALRRSATPLVDDFRRLVASGAEGVGPVAARVDGRFARMAPG